MSQPTSTSRRRPTAHVRLREWDSWAPQPGGEGWEVFLGDGTPAQETARRLTAEDRLSIVETRHGLAVGSKSYVGRVRLGDVTITVRPKLRGLPLWNLMRYAFDLRALHRYDDAAYEAEPEAFQDVVIARLVDEATELIARGLHRTYRARDERALEPARAHRLRRARTPDHADGHAPVPLPRALGGLPRQSGAPRGPGARRAPRCRQ